LFGLPGEVAAVVGQGALLLRPSQRPIIPQTRETRSANTAGLLLFYSTKSELFGFGWTRHGRGGSLSDRDRRRDCVEV